MKRPHCFGIVDGDDMARIRMRSRLPDAAEVAFEASSVAQAEQCDVGGLDGLLVERRLPDGDGWVWGQRVKERAPHLHVFVYTFHAVPALLPRGVHWLDRQTPHEWSALIQNVLQR